MKSVRSASRTFVLVVVGLLCCLPAWGGKPPKDPEPPFVNPAFACDVSDRFNSEVNIISSDGSRIDRLTNDRDGLDKIGSIFSPDGNTIAYLKKQMLGYTIPTDLYVLIRLEDHTWSDPVLVLEDFGCDSNDMDWSPDGSKLLCGGHFSLKFLDMTVPNPEEEVIPLPEYVRHHSPSFSPDLDLDAPGYQGRIVYQVIDDGLGVYDLFILEDVEFTAGSSVQYGVETQLTFTGGPELEQYPAWSPDGTEIAYAPMNGHCIKVITLETPETPRVLYSSDFSVAGPTWSPDGIYIAFSGLREVPVNKKKTERYIDIFRTRADGSEPEPTLVTDGSWLRSPRWNPAWVNDLGD